jgi:tRNA/tmRNA/rRNA uracil-C5-methylase (TrmA/RlmC/RlmD family)
VPEIVVRADAAAHGGTCVGRVDGRVVFCRLCLPGETVRAQVDDDGPGARFWRAEAVAVESGASPDRVMAACAWFGPGLCGGCAWLHADRAAQLRIKEHVLEETLLRIGGITWTPEVRDLGLAAGWRTRLTLHSDAGGRAGFHAARSHEVVPIGDCLQADPALGITELLTRRWPPDAQIHVSVSTAGRAVVVTSADGRTAEGPTEHVHVVAGRRFACAADGFWQSHRLGAQVLVDSVRALVGEASGRTLLDLYAGVGLFGLSMSEHWQQVVLVEGDRRAAGYARANAVGDPSTRVVARDVRRWAHHPEPADVVVLDPPRAGAGRAVVTAIAATRARTVVYVSCEPSTLARDLAWFRDAGYEPDRIEGFDLFPGTAHLETVVRLRPTRR